MKFITSVAAAAALFAAVVSAAGNGFITPQPGDVVPAGEPCLISWKPDTPGPVTIYLMKGDSKDLDEKARIVLLETNFGNYTWNVPSSLASDDDYAFKITWGTSPRPEDVNYTGQFTISSASGDDKDETSTTKTTSATKGATTDSATETKTNTKTETVTKPSNGTATTATASATLTSVTGSATETATETESNGNLTETSASASPSATEDEDNSARTFGFSAALVAGAAVAAIVLA